VRGSELYALRKRFGLTAEDLAAEIGASVNGVLQVEMRKSLSVATSARYAIAAFRLAQADDSKHEALAQEYRKTGQAYLDRADELNPTV
jgi:transcriptional regulator with XRE-family HTH domain